MARIKGCRPLSELSGWHVLIATILQRFDVRNNMNEKYYFNRIQTVYFIYFIRTPRAECTHRCSKRLSVKKAHSIILFRVTHRILSTTTRRPRTEHSRMSLGKLFGLSIMVFVVYCTIMWFRSVPRLSTIRGWW